MMTSIVHAGFQKAHRVVYGRIANANHGLQPGIAGARGRTWPVPWPDAAIRALPDHRPGIARAWIIR
jgi:hypothetical protein